MEMYKTNESVKDEAADRLLKELCEKCLEKVEKTRQENPDEKLFYIPLEDYGFCRDCLNNSNIADCWGKFKCPKCGSEDFVASGIATGVMEGDYSCNNCGYSWIE